LARELLARHHLVDPNVNIYSCGRFVRIEGMCPVGLADLLKKHGGGELPKNLEAESAAAALAALDRDTIYQDRDLPTENREAMAAQTRAYLKGGEYVEFVWKVMVLQPADMRETANPYSLHRTHLNRFNPTDYLTIALYWLGGLADVGKQQPIVPDHAAVAVGPVTAASMEEYVARRLRLPIVDNDHHKHSPGLDVCKLPADVAEQMLASVEPWAEGEATNRAAAKVALASAADDNGDANPPALPSGVGAIDEHDVSMLAFLARSSSLRRKVSDVLPDKGPQDRKAVAKRLRKLADRTPPLVEYPKGGRSGVVILPAGAEALKQATAPTPR